jgi:hypothetical protein
VITLALVLTPFASAQALATLCGLAGMTVDVVPTARGAVAVRAVEMPDEPDDEWDISALVGDDVPAEARELAAAISRTTRHEVVLVTARLAQDSGVEAGLSGQISAQRYAAGEPGDEIPGGLVLASADDVVEDLLLGRRSVAQVPGHVNSRSVTRGRGKWFGKGGRLRP